MVFTIKYAVGHSTTRSNRKSFLIFVKWFTVGAGVLVMVHKKTQKDCKIAVRIVHDGILKTFKNN